MKNRRKGFDAYQIKMIAVVLMTIDHFGAYGSGIGLFGLLYTQLRLIGRLSAPLFFFLITESLCHTRSKQRFLMRLYLAAVCVGLCNCAVNFFFSDAFGQRLESNILFDYFYLAFYCVVFELLVIGIRERNAGRIFGAVCGLIGSCIPHLLWNQLMDIPGIWLLDPQKMYLCTDLIDSFVRSPLDVDYTILFTAMGVAMYFACSKERKALVLLLTGVICYFGKLLPVQYVAQIYPVLGYPQWCMVFAVPFILLYNGERGKNRKAFFYIYYPLHRLAIMAGAWAWTVAAT